MFRIPPANQITGSLQATGLYGELVVAICSRVSRKTVNSVSHGQAYQDSGKSHIAGNNNC